MQDALTKIQTSGGNSMGSSQLVRWLLTNTQLLLGVQALYRDVRLLESPCAHLEVGGGMDSQNAFARDVRNLCQATCKHSPY